MYGYTYFGAEAKADVESIILEVLDAYDARLAGADWLTEETREYARKKLAAITIRAGYQDQLDSWWYTLQIGDEKCAADAMLYLTVEKLMRQMSTAGQPVDRSQWGMSSNTVNACYDWSDNSINFPAAILQEPFYSAGNSREQNLGGIGMVIGHEISHAFDPQGSQYDAEGNKVNWWTDADAEAFAERTARVKERFNSIEVLPDEYVNGEMTIGEAVADLGGIAVTLDLMAKLENPDYDAYFRQLASVWKCRITKERASSDLRTNVHPLAFLRVDISVQQFDEFYATFDIEEGSAMYTAPEDRLKVW